MINHFDLQFLVLTCVAGIHKMVGDRVKMEELQHMYLTKKPVLLACFLLVTCRWYHGTLSRSEAESLLTLCKESSYLVRNSQTCGNDYSLSLR